MNQTQMNQTKLNQTKIIPLHLEYPKASLTKTHRLYQAHDARPQLPRSGQRGGSSALQRN